MTERELIQAVLDLRHALLEIHDELLGTPAWAGFHRAYQTFSPTIERLRAEGAIRHARDEAGQEQTWRWELAPEEKPDGKRHRRNIPALSGRAEGGSLLDE